MVRLSSFVVWIQVPLVALSLMLGPVVACSSTADVAEIAGEEASSALPEGSGTVLLGANGADVIVGLGPRISRLGPDGTLTTLGTIPQGMATRELSIDSDSTLVVHEGNIYFESTLRQSIGRLPLSGGQPEVLPFVTTAVNFFPRSLAPRRDGIFVGAGYRDGGQIWAVDPDGKSARLIAGQDKSLPYPNRLWASPKRLVWMDDAPSFKALDLAEGSKDVPAIRTLEADAKGLDAATAVANTDSIFAFRKESQSVVRIPRDGGPTTTVVTGLPYVSGLAADDGHLYFSLQVSSDDRSYVIEEVLLAQGGVPGTRRVVARSAKPLGPFVLTTTHVVWLDETRKQFRRTPKG